MASVNGVSSNNYVSSLYNSSNIISGLASGLDTESMIENLTKSYQTKITQLQQKQTKLGWKQDAYRSMISKMYAFSNKYTSYTSSSNLRSQSFWNSAQSSAVQGANAGKVSASGTTTSDVVLNSVQQLATSARYVTKGAFGQNNFDADSSWIEASEGIDMNGSTEVNGLQGALSVTYGNKSVSVVFSESDKIVAQKKADGTMEDEADALARVINEKLSEETISLSSGSSVSASDRIQAVVKNGRINFEPVEVNGKGEDKAGNSIYISGGSGVFKDIAPEKPSEAKKTEFNVPKSYEYDTQEDKDGDGNVTETRFFRQNIPNITKISGKTFNINLDGVTKKVTGPKITQEGDQYRVGGTLDASGKMTGGTLVNKDDKNALNAAYTTELNNAVKKEFGNKIKVTNTATDDTLKLNFKVDDGSNLLINTDAGDALGIGKTASNYLSTGKTLEELGVDFSGLQPVMEKDKDGNETAKVDAKGNQLYDFKINGVTVGSYTKDTTLSTILNDINSSDVGVKANYSKTSREFVFTTKDTGEHTRVEMGDGLASAMFGKQVDTTRLAKDIISDPAMQGKTFSVEMENGEKIKFDFKGSNATLKNIEDRINNEFLKDKDMRAYFSSTTGSLMLEDTKTGEVYGVSSYGEGDDVAELLNEGLAKDYTYTNGQDAKFTVTVNGAEKTMTRSSNSTEIDGLTINFKGTFNETYSTAAEADKKDMEGVTFQTEIQADNVVDEVKNMIAELNVMLAEARSNYATLPQQYGNGSIKEYEPLTDEDKAGMSESAIQNYEEKAKQGLLFADSNLSGLYQNLVGVFTRTGMDRTMMDKMGIGLSYDNNGAATITFNEKNFREALENDFDGVVDIFTRSKENGAESDGIMEGIKIQMDRYGSTTGTVKGILVQQAGTPLASLTLLDNGWQKEINSYSDQIEKWQEKLESQVDRYTKMFTRLETLMNQMNSQSSQLASLMGGQ